MLTAGVDIGGTKVAAGVVDEQGRVLARQRRLTPSRDPRAVEATIVDVVQTLRRDHEIAAVGIGAAGFVDADRSRVLFAPHLAWRNEPLRAAITGALDLPVVVENDANAAAWAEWRFGAGRGQQRLVCVTLGTGIGGGIVIDGKVLDGANRLAGEWGHNPFPFRDEPGQGEQCYCGRIDCIETIISGPALARDYEDADGDEITAIEVWARADAGDETAKRLTDRWVERLAMALATVVNVIDPDAIVLGGGLSNVERLYADLPARIAANAFNATADAAPVEVNLLRAKWGDSSGVRGAAWLPEMKNEA